ncbi:MAG TPA: hypothetical protein VMF11_13105 [Candidatus Baltobacteraceae bacterium]|nr:hypothetical protein [Candidatus Baltobacteraceae bacterium]
MYFSLRIAVIVCALIPSLTPRALAAQMYGVTGEDTYRVGTTLRATHIVYRGVERLEVMPEGRGRRYVADVSYTRTGESGKASVHAEFVQVLERDGTFDDRSDEDPDFLTILNQPFAVQLDAITLRDLKHLHGLVPFRAASPLGGSELSGYLRSAPPGKVQGFAVVGVRFEADGPMSGTLPEHPGALLSGRMHMDGTAYYAARGALLLALDATLTIDGKLQAENAAVPVKIIYHRVIRASNDIIEPH